MTNERLRRTLAVLEELYYHELNVLEQLSYVIENIQAPIQQSIKSTYDTSERQPFPEIASLHRRVQKLLTSRLLPENNKVNKKKKNGSKVIHPPASPFRASDKHISAKIGIMSNDQYWTLFANLALLYQSHLEVMEQLHNLLNVLYTACTNLNIQEEEIEVEWEYNVCIFFHSKVVEEFMAQHYMYSVHFTCNAAPLVMQLTRLWRWSVRQITNSNLNSDNNNNNEKSSGSATSSRKEDSTIEIDLQRLCSSDRQKLVCFAAFIDFMYRSFGNAGIPRDSRVHDVHLPENMIKVESITCNNKNESKSHKVSKGVMAHLDYRTHLPCIPPNYVGFYTLLMLLATPLHSLRFLQHTARTLLENKWLCSEYGREVIASHFLSSVHEWMNGANNEINEFTAMDDVHSILSLIDESNMREGCSNITNNNSVVTEQNNKTRNNINSVLDSLSLPHHTRILIHYGHLSINRKRTRCERLFFLFSDVLCYVEELPNGRLMLQGALSLLHIKVNVVVEVANTELANCFEVYSNNNNNSSSNTNTTDAKCLTLCAESAEQRLQWVNAISYATHKLREGQRKVGKSQNEKSNNNNNNNNNNNKMHELEILHTKSRLSRQRCQDVEWQRHFHPTEFVERINTFAPMKQTNGKVMTTTTVDNENIPVNENNKEHEENIVLNKEIKIVMEIENAIIPEENFAQEHKKVIDKGINNFNNNKTTKERHEELEEEWIEEEKPTNTHHEVSSHSHSHSSWSSYITTHRRIRSNEVGTLLLLQPQLSSPSASPAKDPTFVAETERKENGDDDDNTAELEQSMNNLHHHTRTENEQTMKVEEESEEESSEESESSITENTKVHGDSSIFTCKVESTERSTDENNNNGDDNDVIHENNVKITIIDGEATEEMLSKEHSHLHEREVNNSIPLSRLLTERFESSVFVHKVNEQADINEESLSEEEEEEYRIYNNKTDSNNDDEVKNEIQSVSSRESDLHSDNINKIKDNQNNYYSSVKPVSNSNADDAHHNDYVSESLERRYSA